MSARNARAQQERNDELAAVLRGGLHLTTVGGGKVRVSTRRRGEAVSLVVGFDRPEGKQVLLQARNLKSGWAIDLNTTGYTDSPVQILRSILREAEAA